nr:pyridoxamine 5'-phosphate oxidase family protein [Streptomyces sp. RFCAC02]
MRELPPPREAAQRKRDTLRRLRDDEDAWVATAGTDGEPCLTPLWFVWHGGHLVMATRAANPTAVNARRTGRATVCLGHPRDVVRIETDVETVPVDALPGPEAEAFIAKLAWDVRSLPAYTFLRFRPTRITAWRGVNEQPGRLLMHDGTWLV